MVAWIPTAPASHDSWRKVLGGRQGKSLHMLVLPTHSPAIWRDEDAVVADVARTLAARRSLAGFFYLSVGAQEGDSMGRAFDKLRAVLAERAAAAGLRWVAEVTPGAAHETNVRLATPSALRAYFADATSRRPQR